MPHVVVRNPPSLAELHASFTPIKERDPAGTSIELRSAYLRQDARVLLVEAIVLELGPSHDFFVTIEEKKAQLTIRCFRFPTPPRTPGIQRAVARVAEWVLAAGGEVERTNLELST